MEAETGGDGDQAAEQTEQQTEQQAADEAQEQQQMEEGGGDQAEVSQDGSGDVVRRNQ